MYKISLVFGGWENLVFCFRYLLTFSTDLVRIYLKNNWQSNRYLVSSCFWTFKYSKCAQEKSRPEFCSTLQKLALDTFKKYIPNCTLCHYATWSLQLLKYSVENILQNLYFFAKSGHFHTCLFHLSFLLIFLSVQ